LNQYLLSHGNVISRERDRIPWQEPASRAVGRMISAKDLIMELIQVNPHFVILHATCCVDQHNIKVVFLG
jgi:hypothetical protein